MKKYMTLCIYGVLLFLSCLQGVELLHQMYSLSRGFHLLTGLSLLWALWCSHGLWLPGNEDKRIMLKAWNLRFQHKPRVVWEEVWEASTKKDSQGLLWHQVNNEWVSIPNDRMIHSHNALNHVCKDMVNMYRSEHRGDTFNRFLFRRYGEGNCNDIFIVGALMKIKP